VGSAPDRLALERKGGGCSGGDSHRRRLQGTPTLETPLRIFPGSRAVRACPGRFGHLMAAIGRGLATGRFHAQPFTEAGNRYWFPPANNADQIAVR